MKLTLPPGLSPQNYDAAVKALQGVVGADWAMTSDQDRDAYSDIYAPGPERVLYAMDYPYQQSSDEVAACDRMDVSPDHKKMLMQANAEAAFRLG